MVAANFQHALRLVLKHEGGWSDHPRDPGGATNKGITLATYSGWLGRSASKAELRDIPKAHIDAIYRDRYWKPCGGDLLPSGVDYCVFDFGVNSGPRTAVKRLQEIVHTEQDGIVGPDTLAAVNRYGHRKTIRDLTARRFRFLRSLSTWDTFGRGWTRRVNGVEQAAFDMLEEPGLSAGDGGMEWPEPTDTPSLPGGAATGAAGGIAAIGAVLSTAVWWLGLAVIVGAVLYLIIRFRKQIWRGLRRVGSSLQDYLERRSLT